MPCMSDHALQACCLTRFEAGDLCLALFPIFPRCRETEADPSLLRAGHSPEQLIIDDAQQWGSLLNTRSCCDFYDRQFVSHEFSVLKLVKSCRSQGVPDRLCSEAAHDFASKLLPIEGNEPAGEVQLLAKLHWLQLLSLIDYHIHVVRNTRWEEPASKRNGKRRCMHLPGVLTVSSW